MHEVPNYEFCNDRGEWVDNIMTYKEADIWKELENWDPSKPNATSIGTYALLRSSNSDTDQVISSA